MRRRKAALRWARNGFVLVTWLAAILSACAAQIPKLRSFNQCPDRWFRTPSGACLLLTINRTQLTWDTAEQACVDQGAHLASASSLTEWLELNSTCEQSAQNDCWFGAHQKDGQTAPGAGWYWQDCMAQQAVPWDSLVPGVVQWRAGSPGEAYTVEPNDYNSTAETFGAEKNNENCAKFEGGKAVDYVCSTIKPYSSTAYVCGKSRYCSIHGTSVRSGSGSSATCACTCLPGFYGDGQTCEVCDDNASPLSFPNGTSACACTPPYAGNGYRCALPNPPPNPPPVTANPPPLPSNFTVPGANQTSGGAASLGGSILALPPMTGTVNCSSMARLVVQTNGSWGCQCNPPAQGNGKMCLMCDANAGAVLASNGTGLLECQCKPGFQGSGTECRPVKRVNKGFLGVTVAFSLLCALGLCCCLLVGARFWRRRKRKAFRQVRGSSVDPPSPGTPYPGTPYPANPKVTVYSLRELERATNSWAGDNLLGIGSYGEVYRADFADGSQAAVKRCRERSAKEVREFRNEVDLLSRVHHQHLVQLLGYCTEREEQILVYEYMAQGNLRFNLAHDNGRPPLTWRQRLEVALGAAMGLAYLHEGADPPIIHRDVKPSNILLNTALEAKVADFGISMAHRLGPQDHITTTIRGTPGYLDPDYLVTQQLSDKSDVYSFGVVLLELITGRGVTDTTRPANEVYLIRWAKQYLVSNQASAIIEDRIRGQYTDQSAFTVAYLIAQCLAELPEDRPSMSTVVTGLKDALRLEGWGSPSGTTKSLGTSTFSIREPGRQEESEQVMITL
ncbi:receptor-like protein kinase [Klebsormidium nitens]|uniref:Receptor-like protein kinase n=1 Tax=Klebsormidium nitens TaxID=105231 RepID=A0A1Y1HV38_KLENI|nr:receptor-like protein kinase [Klebsormidium nitens]|eukprot:GAQ80407.1 receptor-like protein kinase [Klebsormidium nitens]